MALARSRISLHPHDEAQPGGPNWFDRDASCSPTGSVDAALLDPPLVGYGISLDDLKNFRQLGSPTAGTRSTRTRRVEVTTGRSARAVQRRRFALAERMLAARSTATVTRSSITHVRDRGDGDFQEGVSSERARSPATSGSAADRLLRRQPHPARRADRLGVQRERPERYEAYGGTCRTWARTSASSASRRHRQAHAVTDKPSLIVLRTHIGFGSPNKVDSQSSHGSALGETRSV